MSNLLIDYGLIEILGYYLHINVSKMYILLISMISGFPSGAKYTRELYDRGLIDLDSANKSVMYSHFPNPLFVLGSVNLVLNDFSLALKVLISIILSNLLIFSFSNIKTDATTFEYSASDDFSQSLTKAINNSFQIMFLIYGTSLFFYLISIVITKYFAFSSFSFVFISGLFDLTQGVFSTTILHNNSVRALFILFFITFGSLSIHIQVNSLLSNSPISYKYFFKGRILGFIIAFAILLVLLMF